MCLTSRLARYGVLLVSFSLNRIRALHTLAPGTFKSEKNIKKVSSRALP